MLERNLDLNDSQRGSAGSRHSWVALERTYTLLRGTGDSNKTAAPGLLHL